MGLVILLVNGLVGLFFYLVSVNLSDTSFREDSALQAKHLADAFAQQLWLFDLETTEQLAALAIRSPNIVGLRLVDHQDKLIAGKGNFSDESAFGVEKVLMHNGDTPVGRLLLSFVNDSKNQQRNIIFVTGAITVVATVLTTFILLNLILNRHLVRPLQKLQDDMDELAEGQFRQSSLVGHKKEIQHIIDVFNSMARSLAQREEDRREVQLKLIQSQQRFLSLFISSRDAIFTINSAGEFIDVNPAMRNLFGYTREEMLAMDITGIFTGEVGREELLNEIGNQGAIVDRQVDLLTRSGESKNCMLTNTLWENEKGEILGYHGIIRDITEQKRLEAKLSQAQKMEAIGTLAGGIAHDFNNILAAVIGYAELAREEVPPNSDTAKYLESVLGAGNRAKELVKQILAFSRQTESYKQPVKLQPLIKEALKMLRSSLPTTIEMRVYVDSNCGVVFADPTQIQQILMNLCTNAHHAMETEGGVLTINLKQKQIDSEEISPAPGSLRPGRYAELLVADTGAGIQQEVFDRIFDPYFTTKEPGKGTGMGLSIVHGIVVDHGGEITAQSQLKQGTTFRVFLPVVEHDEVVDSAEITEIPRGKERLLFVDDEKALAEMSGDMLRGLGYSVTVCLSSEDALEAVQRDAWAFDLVITDQTMPRMTGMDLARKMLRIRPGMPIILCTGYSNLVDKESARANGIKGFALKPLTRQTLAVLIRDALKVDSSAN